MSESVRHVTGSLFSISQYAGPLALRAVPKPDSQVFAAIKKA